MDALYLAVGCGLLLASALIVARGFGKVQP